MKRTVTIALFLTAAVLIATGGAEVNQGQQQISLDGGARGPVSFPHHEHQTRLGDCDLCHTLFPQQPGSIEKLKAEGRLTGKQVMTKLCIQCHRAKKAAGLSSGPVACAQCHQKE